MSEYRSETPTQCPKEIDALCESFSLKSFPLFYCDLKFAGYKVHVCVLCVWGWV